MKIDFDAMTKAELRAYLISHPNDQDAFYMFVDRFTSEATSPIFNMPKSPDEIKEIEQLIYQKIAQNS